MPISGQRESTWLVTSERKRVPWMLCLSVLAMFGGTVRTDAQSFQVVARVVDTAGVAIPTARVRIYNGANLLVREPQSVDLRGRFALSVTAREDVRAIRCVVTARGFDNAEEVAPVMERRADCGFIRLRHTVAPRFAAVTAHVSDDNRYVVFDAIIDNPLQRTAIIDTFRLQGSAKMRTNCIDLRPDVVFTISDRGSLNEQSTFTGLSSVEEPATTWRESFPILGTIIKRSCDQILVAINIPKAVQIDAGKQSRIQFRLPKRLALLNGGETFAIEFDNFERLRIVANFADIRLSPIAWP